MAEICTSTGAAAGVADRGRIAPVVHQILGSPSGLAITAYDGSQVGSADAAVTLLIRSPDLFGYVATSPGDLGLARAYVMGAIDADGDLYEVLRALASGELGNVALRERIELIKAVGVGALRRPPIPPEELRLTGRTRHSKRRDAKAIAAHYDVSNQFYEWVLGRSMAYTCAVYPESAAGLDEAQFTKFDLVCRKLGLKPGMRLLDVGCGWGAMAVHAAEHYGVSVLGVTLSRQQAGWAQKFAADRGLSDMVEIRHSDYRDVTETDFDAVSSIGLTEHIGRAHLPAYFASLRDRLKVGGRLLNHCITRPTTTEPSEAGNFINRYVFPDGELEAVGTLVSVMQDAGLEPRHVEDLREHYAMTLRDWGTNLEQHWEQAVSDVGERRARIWRLYMAGSRVSFEANSIQLHQVLGVKVGPDGRSGMPLRPEW